MSVSLLEQYIYAFFALVIQPKKAVDDNKNIACFTLYFAENLWINSTFKKNFILAGARIN